MMQEAERRYFEGRSWAYGDIPWTRTSVERCVERELAGHPISESLARWRDWEIEHIGETQQRAEELGIVASKWELMGYVI